MESKVNAWTAGAARRHPIGSWRALVCAGGLLLCSLGTADERGAAAPPLLAPRGVYVNAVRLPDETVASLERDYRTWIVDGRYWYDNRAGTWGLEGGPTLGFGRPGLALGGTLRSDASGGDTKVFINGRELHRVEVFALLQLGPVIPGRYFADALGNIGLEGGPVFANLYLLAQQRLASGVRLDGPWARTGRYDTGFLGGDASGCMYTQFGEYTHSNC